MTAAATALLAEVSIKLDAGKGNLGGAGQRAGLLLLLGFLLSFGFIRMSTRLMRSPKVPWWPGSVKPGGLHIHHLVFGIVLIMLAGFLQFALRPDSPWLEIFAVAFGVGCGLTLDEFALWLHLEDVYWSEEGRRSIDATIVAAIIGGAIVLGFAPLGAGEDNPTGSIIVVVLTVAIDLALCLICLFKGKLWTGLIGFFVPLISTVGAIRVRQARLALGAALLQAGQQEDGEGAPPGEALRGALPALAGPDRRHAPSAEPAEAAGHGKEGAGPGRGLLGSARALSASGVEQRLADVAAGLGRRAGSRRRRCRCGGCTR